MKIITPIFSLRSPRCECCSNQGALCFSTCPNCGKIVLVCDEVGTTFFDLNNLNKAIYDGLNDPSCICPQCKQVHIDSFRNSTGEEIQAIGFSTSEYE